VPHATDAEADFFLVPTLAPAPPAPALVVPTAPVPFCANNPSGMFTRAERTKAAAWLAQEVQLDLEEFPEFWGSLLEAQTSKSDDPGEGIGAVELRARNADFQRLGKGAWTLFIGIAVHWQGNAEAWPNQQTLSRFGGWSIRAVREQTESLERGGFVSIRRERRADGSERLFYAPGHATLSALSDFVGALPARTGEAASSRGPTTHAAGHHLGAPTGSRLPCPTGSRCRGTPKSRSD
jgi:hypothetical protein